ncbi:hypothetical protein BIW11_05662 [Tropilaelaps mercedesae]|uniref:Uncharacterized protein n=1 Tax=Tropilaelaps mercedesae TaxID=418985 RepID=A0A1V9Y1D7_9ACAR|nr:hypothetical protein BIW11_05662 [Tropilaelaps mercedesae]
MRHKAEWRNYALTVLRACGEVVLIFAFLPEIDARLHLIGAGAGFALACTHQRPPRYIKQEIRPSDITIERPESNVSAKIIGPEGSSILSPDSDAETSGIRRSKLKIVTRRTSKKPPSKPPLESREPSTSRASFPLLPPKVILVLGSTPPMYVPVSIQGTPQPYPARPAGMLRTSQPPTPQNQMTTRPRGSRSPPSCYTR